MDFARNPGFGGRFLAISGSFFVLSVIPWMRGFWEITCDRNDRNRRVTTTNKRYKGGQFVLHAKAFHGNPYDGHTLGTVIEETQALTVREIERAYVNKVYRGHDAQNRFGYFSQDKNAASMDRSGAN